MEAIQDFEDILTLLNKHKTQYLIIGGLAFIYHAKPRYTKDMDLWIGPAAKNIELANQALAEFGSPLLLSLNDLTQIVQIGLAPNRIDLLLKVREVRFETAWKKRVRGYYGKASANWIDLDCLIRTKRRLDNPRHQEDVRVLLEVKQLRKNGVHSP